MAAEATKLDALVEKVYSEGIEKSKSEAETIISNAKDEANKIIEDAKKEAEGIVGGAEKEAEELKRNTTAELKLAGTQAISSLKQEIKSMINASVLGENMKEAFVDADFLKTIITEITKNYSADEAFKKGAELVFPESMKDKIDSSFENSIKKTLSGMTVSFDKRLSGGFKIAPTDGSYQITFTDEDFAEFFKPYLKTKTEKLLFSKEQ